MFDEKSPAFSRLRSPLTTSDSSRLSAPSPTSTAALISPAMSSRSARSSSASRAAYRAERRPAKLLVEEIGRLDQLRLRVGAVGVQDAILHVAFGGDDDQQHAALGQPQEFEVAERRFAPLRRHHDAGELRELRQHDAPRH